MSLSPDRGSNMYKDGFFHFFLFPFSYTIYRTPPCSCPELCLHNVTFPTVVPARDSRQLSSYPPRVLKWHRVRVHYNICCLLLSIASFKFFHLWSLFCPGKVGFPIHRNPSRKPFNPILWKKPGK